MSEMLRALKGEYDCSKNVGHLQGLMHSG